MKTLPLILFSIISIALISGCGTVSDMESTDGAPLFDSTKYSKVAVLDFSNSAPTKSAKKEKIDEHNAKVDSAGRTFADKIAIEIRKKNLFAEVVRTQTEDQSLIIYGAITRYEEGSAAARFLIGLGAGSSYFDADVSFKDNITDNELAVLKVDKNSWVLGGGLAATQTVEAYMNEAARKIANELAKSFEQQTNPMGTADLNE